MAIGNQKDKLHFHNNLPSPNKCPPFPSNHLTCATASRDIIKADKDNVKHSKIQIIRLIFQKSEKETSKRFDK